VLLPHVLHVLRVAGSSAWVSWSSTQPRAMHVAGELACSACLAGLLGFLLRSPKRW